MRYILLLLFLITSCKESSNQKIEKMIFWDVNNGIARRSWARNNGALFTIERSLKIEPMLKVTLPNIADDNIIDETIENLLS